MRQIKTAAVVLDSRDLFDTDRTYLLFTEELGKLWGRARGVRKTTSRLGGNLLPFLPTQIELVPSGDSFLIVQASLIPGPNKSAPYPQDALPYLQTAQMIAEVMNGLFIDHVAQPEAYAGLVYTLERIKENPSPLLPIEFFWKCLNLLGVRPELEQCVLSGEAIQDEPLAWNSQLGGVIRQALLPSEPPPQTILLQNPRSVIALRQLLRPQFVSQKLAMSNEIQEEVIRLVLDFLQTQMGKPLKTLLFWHTP
jgi:DNA repair protein RecO (recombination protein O)